jgi:hypothetical protein
MSFVGEPYSKEHSYVRESKFLWWASAVEEREVVALRGAIHPGQDLHPRTTRGVEFVDYFQKSINLLLALIP